MKNIYAVNLWTIIISSSPFNPIKFGLPLSSDTFQNYIQSHPVHTTSVNVVLYSE